MFHVQKTCSFVSLVGLGTLKSLLYELACLTVLNTVKRASLFNRDLRVVAKALQCSKIELKISNLIF